MCALPRPGQSAVYPAGGGEAWMADMNILFDEERLRSLIANLNILTGLPANILDP